jgi:putative transposase
VAQRWQADDDVRPDRRPGRRFEPANKLSEDERSKLLAVANSAEFGDLPPSQIVPRLADRGEYVASESTFYRVLRLRNSSSTAVLSA